MGPARNAVALACALAGALAGGGCVRRTLCITSDPPGALVWLNDREIGRTPVDVDFVHYGTYDVRLVAEGCAALVTTGKASPPVWDNVGLDLVAEVLPVELTSAIEWHYTLEPLSEDPEAGRAELRERAAEARAQLEAGD